MYSSPPPIKLFLRTIAGKILSYHSESFYESEENNSVSSSVATPIARNSNHDHERRALRVEHFVKNESVRTPNRLIRLLMSLFILGFFVLEGLSWFANDASNNSYQLQTTVSKNSVVGKLDTKSINTVLQQHIMDVNMAAFKASTSQLTFWEPFLDLSASSANEVVNSVMNIMSTCYVRDIFTFLLEGSGLNYVLQPQPIQDGSLSSINKQISSQINLPRVVFTPNFLQASIDLLDPYHQGAFMTIFHDPIEMYLEHLIEQKELVKKDKSKLVDNMLVRYLSGINDANREVTTDDYDVARHVLVSKFVIGSCDNPDETLSRLDKMIIDSDNILIASGDCTNARQRWRQECNKMKKIEQRNRGNKSYRKLLKRITSTHQYDIELYELSKNLFREQAALF